MLRGFILWGIGSLLNSGLPPHKVKSVPFRLRLGLGKGFRLWIQGGFRLAGRFILFR